MDVNLYKGLGESKLSSRLKEFHGKAPIPLFLCPSLSLIRTERIKSVEKIDIYNVTKALAKQYLNLNFLL